jgi:carbon-monoxide dehydrogenase medium subunit
MSLDADVTMTSKSGTRNVALDDYYFGYKRDARRPDELLTAISWPRPTRNTANSFYKLARRVGDAITVTGVAVTLSVENGACAKARIVLGAVSPVVLRAKSAEALLEGETLTPALIDAAAARAVDECAPIDDVRASAEYRRHTVETLTRRLVTQAWQALS